MATLKIKKTPGTGSRTARAPVRGVNGLRSRPTMADKEARRTQQAATPPGHSFDDQRSPVPGHAKPRRPNSTETTALARPQRTASAGNTAFAGRPVRAQPRPPAPVEADTTRPERPPTQPEPARRLHRPAVPAPDMRLSKRMSELGIASRREADEWIAKGWVRVDGKVVSELGSRVRSGQLITVDTPAKFHQARKVTVLLNKPVGYVSGQAEDGHEPAWVLIRPENQWLEDGSGIRFRREHTRGLAPAGRLDLDSVGLLVMTQDGRIAKQLIGDDSTVEKEYLVRVAPVRGGQPLSEAGLARLNHGLSLDDTELKPARVEWVKEGQLRFVLQEGRKRQIRRMCEAVGLQVVSLERVRIGQVQLGSLPPGRWRYLRMDETFGD